MNRNEIYRSLNRLRERTDFVFLTNCIGEETGSEEIPQAVRGWYRHVIVKTNCLLYLVRIDRQYGLLIVTEFDKTNADDDFDGSRKKMSKQMYHNASILKKRLEPYRTGVYSGECIVDERNEINVFVPYSTELSAIEKIISITDEQVHQPMLKSFGGGHNED